MNRKWTRTSRLVVMVAVALLASPVAWGQSTGPKEATDTSGGVTVQEEQTPAAEAELGIIALQRIAKGDKYAFVFFFRDEDERTQTMRKTLESAIAKIPDKAEIVTINVTDPLEAGAVNRFGVSRAPMPLILALAPTGAVTKSWLRDFDAAKLGQAFVSPGEAECLKAFQDRKLVLVCIQNGKTAHNAEAMQGVNEFKTDRLYADRAATVSIDPTDEVEADFLKKLRVSPDTKEAVTVLMAPPGRPVATFTGATNKAGIIAATKKAGSGCDPKSGCCGPKKPAPKPTGSEKKL